MKSIALKLWAGMIALVVVMIIMLWIFQIMFLENFYTKIKISEAKSKGYSVIKQIEDGNKDSESLLDGLANKINANVELVDSYGETVYSAGSSENNAQMPKMMNSSKNDAIKNLLAEKETTVYLTHPKFNTKFVIIGLPAKGNSQLKGGLLINLPLAPVKDTASVLKVQLLYVTVILLFVTIIFAYFLAKSFSRPILQITKASEEMASGNFSVKVESKSRDEIGQLASTINYMGEELSKTEQLRKDIIANVSHELRTPLSLIQGYAETIKDVTGNVAEKREKQLEIIIDEAERLGKIVDDILNLSQIQAGYANLNKTNFNISELLERVVKNFEILSEKTGIEINMQHYEDKIVLADETRIEQVVYNLLNNAFNHTESSGYIIIRQVETEKCIRIEVEDTGTGISEENLEHIWDRFYKTEKVEGRKSNGTGLGLTIVKTILDSHKFKYGVESTIGIGTKFWFQLEK